MWTNEEMDMYAAKLDDTERMILAAVRLGYDIDEALDLVFLFDPMADLSYAEAFYNSTVNPDKRVPLEV